MIDTMAGLEAIPFWGATSQVERSRLLCFMANVQSHPHGRKRPPGKGKQEACRRESAPQMQCRRDSCVPQSCQQALFRVSDYECGSQEGV